MFWWKASGPACMRFVNKVKWWTIRTLDDIVQQVKHSSAHVEEAASCTGGLTLTPCGHYWELHQPVCAVWLYWSSINRGNFLQTEQWLLLHEGYKICLFVTALCLLNWTWRPRGFKLRLFNWGYYPRLVEQNVRWSLCPLLLTTCDLWPRWESISSFKSDLGILRPAGYIGPLKCPARVRLMMN